MTQAQIVEIAANVLLDYSQPLSLAHGIEATERIMAIIRAHPAYHYDDDHVSIAIDGVNGTLDVRLFESRELLYTSPSAPISP